VAKLWYIKLIGYFALLFLYLPIAVVIVMSFNSGRREWEGFSLIWYQRLASNTMLADALINSLKVGLISTVFSTILGVIVAYYLIRTRVSKFFKMLVSLPLYIPDIVLGLSSLSLFVLISFPLSIWSITLAHITFCSAFVALVVSSKLALLDKKVELAAKDLGATDRQTIIGVVLPQLKGAIIAAALLSFTLSFDDYVVASFTGGPGSTTLPVRIYSLVKFGVTPEINALSTILFIAAISIALIVARVDSKAFTR